MKMDIEEVTEIALKFMQKAGYSYIKVISVRQDYGKWVVTVGSGVFEEDQKTVTIEDATGKVIEYG